MIVVTGICDLFVEGPALAEMDPDDEMIYAVVTNFKREWAALATGIKQPLIPLPPVAGKTVINTDLVILGGKQKTLLHIKLAHAADAHNP